MNILAYIKVKNLGGPMMEGAGGCFMGFKFSGGLVPMIIDAVASVGGGHRSIN